MVHQAIHDRLRISAVLVAIDRNEVRGGWQGRQAVLASNGGDALTCIGDTLDDVAQIGLVIQGCKRCRDGKLVTCQSDF